MPKHSTYTKREKEKRDKKNEQDLLIALEQDPFYFLRYSKRMDAIALAGPYAWYILIINVFRFRDGQCRECGCVQNDCRQCIKKTGGPCHWIEPDLCSACVKLKKKK